MTLETTKSGNVTVVKILTPRFDAAGAPNFKQEVAKLIERGDKLLVLNLSEVNFLDSIGLAALISTLKLIGDNGDLVIAGSRVTVQSIFKLTRMDKVFRIFKNVPEAVSALSS